VHEAACSQCAEAFPWNEVRCYLIRDRDGIYGAAVTRRLRAMGMRDKLITPGSPWQNGYEARLIGTIRRECLDHLIVCGEAYLRRIQAELAKVAPLRLATGPNSGPSASAPSSSCGIVARDCRHPGSKGSGGSTRRRVGPVASRTIRHQHRPRRMAPAGGAPHCTTLLVRNRTIGLLEFLE
jgi:hypothetical protein